MSKHHAKNEIPNQNSQNSRTTPQPHHPLGQPRRENGMTKQAGELYHDQLPGDDWMPSLYFDQSVGCNPEDADYDYFYEVGGYVVHLQVRDGAIAFLDSQCPDHVCEDFGWLSRPGQWACCVPAGVFVTIEETES